MLPSLFRHVVGAADQRRARAIPLLRALNITRVSYALIGEGDSGECTLDEVEYVDGSAAAHLPALPIGFAASGAIQYRPNFLGDLAADFPDGDWVNNEGGYGDVTILPFETELRDCFVCDMTYRDYYDDDDEEFEDLDLEEGDPAHKADEGGAHAIRIVEAGE